MHGSPYGVLQYDITIAGGFTSYSSGTFSINTTGQPVVTGTTISSSVFNTLMTDIATGLTTCVLKDGTQTITANIPMANFKITGLGASTAVADVPQTSQVQNSGFNYLTSVAGTNTITATATPTPAAYAAGQEFSFIPAVDNTGATTLNISSLGAKNIFWNGVALVGGELNTAQAANVIYDGTQFQLINPHVPSTIGYRRKNAIINGDFPVAQRGTSFTAATTPPNSDDTFLLDRWILLSDGNDVVDVVQEATTIPTDGLYAISLDVETINKKFGILQVIEQKNCKGFIGKTCTLSFKAKVSATTKLDNLKAAIISWDGTADIVTSDIVSAWSVENTVPVLVANWTYENTAVNLTPTTSYATYSVTATIDTASTTNIGVFIWSDVTDTTLGDFLFITDVQLEAGSVATEFEQRTFNEELALCQRYYEKSFNHATAPAQNAGVIGPFTMSAGKAGAASEIGYTTFKVEKWATPTITFYNPSAANAQFRDISATADCTSTLAYQTGSSGFSLNCIGNASTAVGNILSVHWQAVSEL